mgnify:CR=1 FL=1
MHAFDFDKIDLRTVDEIDDAAGVVRKHHVVGPAAHDAAGRQADGPVTRGLQRSEALIEVDSVEPIRARSAMYNVRPMAMHVDEYVIAVATAMELKAPGIARSAIGRI